jgi:hypothetical protein
VVDLTYLQNNVFAGESGGDYNALYGYANRGSGPFGGVNVTDMTINQVLDFTDPRGPYAQSVKGQIGRVATPTGAYQVVGSTLRDAVRGLGLTGNERYDAATQDRIGQWIYENQGPQAWEGWGKTGGGGGNTSLMGGAGNDNLGAGMEPEQTGLLGFLGNDEKRARLSLALSGLSMFPNRGIEQLALDTIGQAQQGRLDQRAEDKTLAAENRTLQYIANLGTPQAEQALAYAQGTGDVAGALKMAMQTANPMDALTLQKTQLEIDQMREGDPQGQTVDAATLRLRFPNAVIEDGLYSVKPDGTISKVGGGGTTVNVGGESEFGTIPSGYMLMTDPVTKAKSLVPIAGGPAALEAETAAERAAQRQGLADAATQTIVGTAAKAREAAQDRLLTGPLGSLAAINPATQNAEMYRQVESLKSQAALGNIQALRDASPTGGALGAASDADMQLLREKSGALDPRSPNFLRDLDDYELTLLQTVHGFAAGTQIFNQTRGGNGGANVGTGINGVTVGEGF